MSYRLLYFASLADRAGCSAETRDSDAATPRELYGEVAAAYGLSIPPGHLRVAVNGAFVDWEHVLARGDEVVFIPPVSGG